MDVLFFVRKGKVPKETPALMFHNHTVVRDLQRVAQTHKFTDIF